MNTLRYVCPTHGTSYEKPGAIIKTNKAGERFCPICEKKLVETVVISAKDPLDSFVEHLKSMGISKISLEVLPRVST